MADVSTRSTTEPHGTVGTRAGARDFCPAGSAPGLHPRDLPEPLRRALIGGRARRRLDRLLVIAGHASILQAAQALGIWQSILYQQVARLEHACGGPLVHRGPALQAPGS
jgi:hypothetical protein